MTQDNSKPVREKSILVAINPENESHDKIDEYLDELERLADTAGADTVMKVFQDRTRVHSAHYVGKGKVEEIRQLAEMNDANLIVFDDDLTSTQMRNLEKMIEKKILDRSGLILDIFAAHARTNEAKTQVELAQLQYMLPRLTRAWTHLSKQYGGIGTKGPGETQIETDRRLIRDRIARLKQKLDKIELQQHTRSAGRKPFIKISLVGYTNAGKSTLLNQLTDAGVLAQDKLFATLDSTTRSLLLDNKMKILLSDTVGFIRKLPHNLVASFKSTLNVVRDADIILHVVDITHPYYEDHIKVVEDTLADMECGRKKIIMVFNKVDALKEKEALEYVKNKYEHTVLVSAKRGINVSGLLEYIQKTIDEDYVQRSVSLKHYETRIESEIYQLGDVLEKEYDNEHIHITFRAKKGNSDKIERLLNGR